MKEWKMRTDQEILGLILGTVKTLKVDAGKNSSISSSIIWRMTLLKPVSLRVWMLHIITKGITFTREGSYKVQVKVMIIFF